MYNEDYSVTNNEKVIGKDNVLMSHDEFLEYDWD